MFSLFPESVFSEVLHGIFEYLDETYVERVTPQIIDELDALFREIYETRFVIVDGETGEPMSRITLASRQAADDCARVVGGKASVAFLIIEK